MSVFKHFFMSLSDQPVLCHNFLFFFKYDWMVIGSSHLSLKATVKPSHWLLLFSASSCSHGASVEVMKYFTLVRS